MKPIELRYEKTNEGVTFVCTDGEELFNVETWASLPVVIPTGGNASPGIFALLEDFDGYSESDDGQSLRLTHAVVAGLTATQLSKLGLPPASELRLKLNTFRKLLTNPEFKISYGFTYKNLPIHKLEVGGAFVTANGREYTLLEPYYSIVRLVEEYNSSPVTDLDDRFKWWGKISELLPKEVDVDRFLGTLHVVSPNHFSVDFIETEKGLEITPRFVVSEPCSEINEGSLAHVDMLPPAVMRDFNSRFLGRPDVDARYAAKDKWFVVLPDSVHYALKAVHEINKKSDAQKRAFLQNPRKAIREKLEQIADPIFESEELVESLFVETKLFLSERIKCLGEWHPKKGLFIKTEGGQWLPEDGVPPVVGVPIADRIVDLKTEDLPRLHEKMSEALAKGHGEVVFDDKEIPVTEDTVKAVGNAAKAFGPPHKPAPKPNEDSDSKKKTKPHVPLIYDHIEELGIEVTEQKLRKLAGCPEALAFGVQLHAHQKDGLKWLKSHWEHAAPGALLADDMGLGKTIQTLAFMSWIKEQIKAGAVNDRPLLIVAPTGLLKNWEEEAEKFLPENQLGFLVKAFGKSFSDVWRQGLSVATRELQDSGWVLTTYETLRDKILAFTGINWSVVAFDEAQKIKSPRAMVTEMAKSLKAEFTLAITGTPVENSLTDLWCIVDAVQPGRLDTLKSFATDFINGGSSSEEDLKRLKDKLEGATPTPLMLRRSKDKHWKEKPVKSENLVRKLMPKVQADAYKEQVERAQKSKGKKGIMLEVLHGLRMTSLHPSMGQDFEDPDEFIEQSARLVATFEILKKAYAQQEKVLIFVEYKEMQAKLAELIQRRFNCPSVMLINGAISGAKRQQRVREFQGNDSGFEVMLLSPKAGGVGLTLTAATHVIHLTRWWNPAVEDQCTDRAYRIGQQSDVTVHYPIAIHPEYGVESSFDVKLHELLDSKRVLSRTLLAPPAATHRDTESLFSATVNPEKLAEKPMRVDMDRVDIMEPIEFEHFVHGRFKKNYSVRETPRSGDGGADGVCIANEGSNCPNILLQCKHTQSDSRISVSAVDEILSAQERYPDVVNPELWVITNGYFDQKAIDKAGNLNVTLIDRDELMSFST